MNYNITKMTQEVLMSISRRIQNIDVSERNYEVNKRLEKLKNTIIAIAQEMNIPVNEDYISSQLEVLKHQISVLDKQNSEDLFAMLSNYLQKYEDEVLEGKKIEELTNRKRHIPELMEKSKDDRRMSDNSKIMLIEEYVHDVYSNIMRRLINLGVDNRTIEEIAANFKHRINSFSNRSIEELAEYSESTNKQLFEEIINEVKSFFRDIEMSTEERKSIDNEENSNQFNSFVPIVKINTKDAIEAAESKSNMQNDLPDDIIK